MAQRAGAAATIRRLMMDFRSEGADAAGRLRELLYPEWRRIAAARMQRERPGHTWQPTVLVNEVYPELARVNGLPPGSADVETEKAAFFGLAGFLMKRLLIHHARPLYRRADKTAISDNLQDPVSWAQSLHEIEDLLDGLVLSIPCCGKSSK